MKPDRNLLVVGLGEALFDLFPSHAALGGAPLNVAVHAHQLLRGHGGQGVTASRIGHDEWGHRVRSELAELGVSDRYLQVDETHPTGQVRVTLDPDGQPDYEIVERVAWDYLEWSAEWEELARSAGAVCFGSLAQRNPHARATVARFLESTNGLKLFDVNLRQHYYDANLIAESLERCDVVKVNRVELIEVSRVLNVATDPEVWLRRWKLKAVVVTAAADGTTIYDERGPHRSAEAAAYPMQPGCDSVGAGDACSAGLLTGWLLGFGVDRVVELGDHLGAYVASQAGATPRLPESILQRTRA